MPKFREDPAASRSLVATNVAHALTRQQEAATDEQNGADRRLYRCKASLGGNANLDSFLRGNPHLGAGNWQNHNDLQNLNLAFFSHPCTLPLGDSLRCGSVFYKEGSNADRKSV